MFMKFVRLTSQLPRSTHVVLASLVLHSASRALVKSPAPSSLASLTMASPIVTMSFTEATEKRRSIRALDSMTTVPDSTIVKLAEAAILTVPSAFDSQSTRLTVLFANDHRKLWALTADAMLAKIGEERWNGGTKDRIANFANAYGTILFWDDQSCAAAMKEHAPDIYKDNTEEWVHQSNGMHQYYLWTALEALGLGANLQHYNPLIDAEVQKTWSVPSDWKLKAQMVFGVPREGSAPGEKAQKLPLEQKLQVFGANAKVTSMFHRFSATPAKARSQTKGSGSARARNRNNDAGSKSSLEHRPKRQKTARACDRCCRYHIKCDEQKPCTQCVIIKAKCIVSYAAPRSSQTNNIDTGCESSCSLRPPLNGDSRDCNSASPSIPLPVMGTRQENTRTPPDNGHKEYLDLDCTLQGISASGQPAFSHTSAIASSLFPQLPHVAVPSGEFVLASNTLLKSQRSYYLRLFWDICHPLLMIISEAEFGEPETLQPPTMFEEYSVRSALIDSMIALGIQHSHVTGLAGRILGLPQPPRQYHNADPLPDDNWPGFEYFHRSRERMRTNKEVTLEAIRCHVLMALYLMKGNAIRDAYNLLGITVRKAYIAKLHRPPPSHLPEAGKTARMQLWWMLFSLDFQCSLQLDLPAACQKSLVKCPFPAEEALGRYVYSPNHQKKGINSYTYSTCLVNFAVTMTDISACVSTADLDDDGNSPAALEHHALRLSSALQNLEIWRDQLPSELILSRREDDSGNTDMLDVNLDLALPAWLQRQMVLLELHYHNAYTLVQRPFIRLRHASSNDASSMITSPGSRQPHAELHIAGALDHASIIIDTVFAVCSTTDVLYGWSEVLQPLWNAVLTITAYVYANPQSPVVPRTLDSLTRALAVFESFSSTCPAILFAKDIVQSLTNSLQNMMAMSTIDPMGWDLLPSLLQEQQTATTGLESAPSSNDIHDNVLFPSFRPSASHFNLVAMQSGNS
ncbi:hypothetical protein UA08_02592 [Talaromyces atroroseus]|uniref:Zn(2)-C6 fungal-type domain-containing protein n=1 Tax=Talaromyces atroroseus TaxID=1441469 RepID=A0A225AYC9_TALAT|nr:hypothetical protein UA08_02592 [Talaromyces atroroseus]OKL62348.1 hypothetical protein UA08_02592 [Talaromyces atroroseus]